jgi:hypothetical protein
MGVLRRLAAVLLAPVACYQPRLPDCTVRCASSDDCAPGQTCDAQGYCAAPGLACPAGEPDAPPPGPPIDAPPPIDARPPIDALPIDAAPNVQLRVRISGSGAVDVEGAGRCDAAGPDHGDCRYSVTPGTPLELLAIPYSGSVFEEWTSAACATAGATCVFTPIAPMTEVRARFMHDD